MDIEKILIVFTAAAGLSTIRYFLIAGIAFGVFWVLFSDRFANKWIQKGRAPEKEKVLNEIKYSLSTMLVFGFIGILVFFLKEQGWTFIYKDIYEYGWAYYGISLVGLILLHDTYFYWTHRLMHHPKIFKTVHLVHHRSTNPSPFASFSFHPTEAIIEAGIIPLAVVLFPLHGLTIFSFLIYMTFLNVLGHLAFETFPSWFLRNPITKWHNTSTHHNMHHRYFNCNYGLYFNWWDTWMGTNHKHYVETFEEVSNSKENRRASSIPVS